MFKVTDTSQLGTIYRITDINGEDIGTMQVIYATELLDLALGQFDETFPDYTEYLTQSSKYFTGCEENDIYRTLWWSVPMLNLVSPAELESQLTQAFEHAIKYGYDAIILEDIPPNS